MMRCFIYLSIYRIAQYVSQNLLPELDNPLSKKVRFIVNDLLEKRPNSMKVKNPTQYTLKKHLSIFSILNLHKMLLNENIHVKMMDLNCPLVELGRNSPKTRKTCFYCTPRINLVFRDASSLTEDFKSEFWSWQTNPTSSCFNVELGRVLGSPDICD